ncbi:PIR protein CIR protein [Plasmodium vinckei]|uniref:PIR protein CIR protein n=1 Tax=Plasmodium vinckei TaxID=5860 RepID=A0A6V7SHS6_PLAVN|nr:PIR protein CIR protein [Plasmodium vinckei]
MDDKVCDLLSEVDDLFTRGIVNEKKFNNFKKCHSYCPRKNNSKENKCTNDYERFNALVSYLFTKISEIGIAYKQKKGVSHHIELFMIWLGGKLFKMDNDYKATLEGSYKKHLVNIMGNVNYWEIISKNIYKDATIRKMDELYSLLNNICKLITEYNKNTQKPDNRRLGNHSTQCINSYRSFYRSASGCKPYLRLLDNLKMIYENFRFYKMDLDSNLKGHNKELLLKRIKHLTMFKDENQLFVSVNENLSFDDKECKEAKSKDEQIGKSITSKNLQNKPKGIGPTKKSDTGPQRKSSPSTSQGKKTLLEPAKPPTAPRPQPQPKQEAKQQKASQSQTQSVAPIVPTTSPATPSVQSPDPLPASSIPVPPQQSTDTKQADSQQTGPLPAVPPSQDGGSLQTPKTGEIHQNRQGGTVDRKGETSSGSGVTQDNQGGSSGGSGDGQGSGVHGSRGAGGEPDASKSGKKDSDSSKGNKDSGTNGGANDGSGTPGSGANGGGSIQGDQGNPSVGSNDQGDKNGGSSDPASSTPVGSFDWMSSIFEFILKGKEYYNKASEFIKGNQQKFKDAAEKISGAYNDTVENLKSAYNASSDYVNNLINDVIDQFNQTDPPSKQNGNHSGTGNPSGVGNPSNQLPPSQPQNTTDPPTSSKNASSDPVSNQKPNSLSTSSKDPLRTTPTDPSKGSQPPSPQALPPATPPGPPKVSLQQIQSPPQSQPITQQPTQAKQTNHQKIDQFIKSLSSDIILKKTWNIFPTTWNGSGDCKPEIKFMNATLVCCTSEQCSLTGITVTLVLIPIILLIAYKYLSFGLSKKSEKKNMKKVINFHDGNRKTKIIISSYDNKKKLKPVINSVGGKKGPLLNIYKLIRADPMPFINLFFLLIFFVYKRKRDTIE